jgi:hypothetical protein
VEETSAGVSTGHMWKKSVNEVRKTNQNCLFRAKKQKSLKMKSNQTFPFTNPKNTQESMARGRLYQQQKSLKNIVHFRILTIFEIPRSSFKYTIIFFQVLDGIFFHFYFSGNI